MSRSNQGSKGPGHEYWKSRLHPCGKVPGPLTKRLTHRKERRVAKGLIRGILMGLVVFCACGCTLRAGIRFIGIIPAPYIELSTSPEPPEEPQDPPVDPGTQDER